MGNSGAQVIQLLTLAHDEQFAKQLVHILLEMYEFVGHDVTQFPL